MDYSKRLKWLPDSLYLQVIYYYHFHKFANLRHPKTFNEKLQWLKLHDRRPEYITMVDKFAVKDYVAGKIGQEFIIPTIGAWESLEVIDFDTLPNQFVLKWNHDSKSVVICSDKSKFDKEQALRKLQHGACVNGYWYGREWPYKGVKPKIIAEQYISQDDPLHKELTDYKFMCFNGEVKSCFVCTGRFSPGGTKVTFYDNDWNILPFERSHPRETEPIQKPYSYDKMKWAAEELSKGIPFARIDFYEVDRKPLFGEITLYPGSGLEAFQPEKWDTIYGSWIDLKNVKSLMSLK